MEKVVGVLRVCFNDLGLEELNLGVVKYCASQNTFRFVEGNI
jgi:hypothetical protein